MPAAKTIYFKWLRKNAARQSAPPAGVTENFAGRKISVRHCDARHRDDK